MVATAGFLPGRARRAVIWTEKGITDWESIIYAYQTAAEGHESPLSPCCPCGMGLYENPLRVVPGTERERDPSGTAAGHCPGSTWGDSLSVQVTRSSGTHVCTRGCWAEAAACSHIALPPVECAAPSGVSCPDPEGPRKQEAGGWLSPTAAKLFCLLSWAICFSAVFSRLYVIAKNRQQRWHRDHGCQPPNLPPSAFLFLPFPFLVISVATQICEKRLAFYRQPSPSTVLLSVFVGRPITHSWAGIILWSSAPLWQSSLGACFSLTKRRVVCVLFWQLSLLEQSKRPGMLEREYV